MKLAELAEAAGLKKASDKMWYGTRYSIVHEDRLLKFILNSPILMRNVINKLID